MPMRLEGSCRCGAISFSVDSHTPYPYQRCYCSICRKSAGGGGYAINIMGLADTLKVKGKSALGVWNAPIDGHKGSADRGVKPYIRATCNPDADSWVADFLAWWIDPESGLPIPERAGVLRYYIRVAETIMWADRPEELMQDLPRPEDLPPGIDPPRPISVTFIPARALDNPILLQVNPEDFTWLLSLPLL